MKIRVTKHARDRIRKYHKIESNSSIYRLTESVFLRGKISESASKRYATSYRYSKYLVDSGMVWVFRMDPDGSHTLITTFPAPFSLLIDNQNHRDECKKDNVEAI